MAPTEQMHPLRHRPKYKRHNSINAAIQRRDRFLSVSHDIAASAAPSTTTSSTASPPLRAAGSVIVGMV
jgi:hypothetical protein